MATDLGVKVVNNGKYYFISYNTEDAQLVSKYLKAMDDAGLPVWYDNGIPRGEKWETIIAEKICGCESMIMFLSSNLFKKENSFVKKEWSIAKKYNIQVYLVFLDNIDEEKIPTRYDFWWTDIKETQSILAYTMDINDCVKDILKYVGYKRKIAEVPSLSINNNDFDIEEGVLKKYKGKASVVEIPFGVTSIGDSAFSECESLVSVVIPYGVTSIGEYAFFECKSLVSVVIPYGVTSIGDRAFSECESLASVVIPCGVTSIGEDAFSFCESLMNITIPDSVISIGRDAFYQCKSLMSITIPDSVISLGEVPFCECSSLLSINVHNNNNKYKSVDGNLYSKDGKVFIKYPEGKNEDSYVIRGGVTSIDAWAFSFCEFLTNVTIPDGVASIGDCAFSWCGLTSITIPDSVISIGEGAFEYSNLETIIYQGSEEQWKKIKFGIDWDFDTSENIQVIFEK